MWIEFSDETDYLKWLRAVMFLLKTTSINSMGIRDPRRARDNEQDLVNPKNKNKIYLAYNKLFKHIIDRRTVWARYIEKRSLDGYKNFILRQLSIDRW